MYTYKAHVDRVIDGDTFEATVDLGFKLKWTGIFRLHGIDTPETWRPKSEAERSHGEKAKEFVKKLIDDKDITLITYKEGIYARYLADVVLKNGNDLATLLRENNLEKLKSYE